MLRVSSEIAVATSVRSVGPNPSAAASSRPFWRAKTTSASETLLLRSGVVGSHLPPLSASVHAVNPGDMLILATDGIRPGFAEELLPLVPPQPAADRILSRYARGTDDALVLVARYRGGTA